MTDHRGTRVLVTGGAGFIGSNLVDWLLAAGVDAVVVVDSFFLGRESNLEDAERVGAERLIVHREDAADQTAMARIIADHRPDVVFNLATKPLLYSFFNPPGAMRLNVDIALTLAELLRAGAFRRLIHVSSSEVYGSAVSPRMTEQHPLLPETTYAAGKASADLSLLAYRQMFGLEIHIVRPFNNYGPRQNKASMAAVVPVTIARILRGDPPVIEGDGLQTRDFSFVLDTVDAVGRIGFSPEPPVVVNLGSGREITICDVVARLCQLLGYDGVVEQRAERPADVQRHCADTSLLDSYLELTRTSLDDGLAATVTWYRTHRD